MTDILDELKAQAALYFNGIEWVSDDRAKRAVREIERLNIGYRELIEEREIKNRQIAELRVEIERLRAQLKRTEQSLDAEFHNSIKLAAKLALNIQQRPEPK